VRQLGLPLLQRHYYQLVVGVVFIIGWSWLLSRIVQQVARRVRERAIYTGRTGTESLLLLGERVLKAIIFIVAVFAILGSLGFNMTTALAGLGIGGIAVAFAAQKTLENLFGGVSLLGDEVIRVGDVCRFGDRVGTVEDISLRSTRIRTPERSELSIPNGSLATMNLENLSRRDKILFNTKLGLRYETSADQLRYVLAQIRRLLYEHPKVETDGARIRFIGYDNGSLNLEVFCYAITRDGTESRNPGRSSAQNHGHCRSFGHHFRLPLAHPLSEPRLRSGQRKDRSRLARGPTMARKQPAALS
jgi:MscS family membrane protein